MIICSKCKAVKHGVDELDILIMDLIGNDDIICDECGSNDFNEGDSK